MNGKVRIKDTMRSAYTSEQWLGVQIDSLMARRLVDRESLDRWQIREAFYLGPDRYRFIDKRWRAFGPGAAWGGEDRTAFMRCRARVPERFDGKYGALLLRPGGEALLRVDGRPFAGLDVKHDVVFLAKRLQGGKPLELEIEAFVKQMDASDGIHHTFGEAAIVLLDREVEDACFDFKCAYDVMACSRASEPVRTFLYHELRAAVAEVDFYAADAAAFKKTLLAARARLRARVYESGHFGVKGRLNMVSHSHLDLVYLWDYKEFLRKIGRTHATALNMMREFPDFIFCQSQLLLYEELRRLHPQIYRRIKRQIRSGRWEVVGGMYVEPDCNLISGESLVRQLLVGQRAMKQAFDLPPSRICWLPDVFGNSWIMPQILRRAGLRTFITNKPVVWNDTNEFPHNTFWWEGPDGSRVLAHMPATHFGGGIDADGLLTNWGEFKQKETANEAMFNFGHGDGRGGPSRDDFLYGRRFARFPGVPAAEYTPGEVAMERAEAAASDALPVWRDEIYLETHRGTYTTQAILKRLNRRAEVGFRRLEATSALASLLGKRYPKQRIDAAWRLILKNQFHDILPGSHVTAACRDALQDYEQIAREGNALQEAALGFFARRVDHRAKEPCWAVFNAQTWARDDVVQISLPASSERGHFVDADGTHVPHQRVWREGGGPGALLALRAVPPMGYTTVRWLPGRRPVAAAPTVEARALENDLFRLELAADGTIARLYDKRSERDVLDSAGGGNRFALYEDISGRYPAWDIVPMYRDRAFDDPGGDALSDRRARPGARGPRADVALRGFRDPPAHRAVSAPRPHRLRNGGRVARAQQAAQGRLPGAGQRAAGDLRPLLRDHRATDSREHQLGRREVRGLRAHVGRSVGGRLWRQPAQRLQVRPRDPGTADASDPAQGVDAARSGGRPRAPSLHLQPPAPRRRLARGADPAPSLGAERSAAGRCGPALRRGAAPPRRLARDRRGPRRLDGPQARRR